MASTKEQIKELEELCQLYIKSNPNFLNKDGKDNSKDQAEPKGDSAGLTDALWLVTRVQVLTALIKEDP